MGCELANIIKQSGQEAPSWLSEGVIKYTSIANKERSFLSNLVIFSFKKLLKVLKNIFMMILSLFFHFLGLLRLILSPIMRFVQDYTKNTVKSALWMLVRCCLASSIVILLPYLIIFGCHPLLQGTKSVYLNVQKIGYDLHVHISQWFFNQMIGEAF